MNFSIRKKLTDERIEKELRNNTTSKDYILCPKCKVELIIRKRTYLNIQKKNKKTEYVNKHRT